MSNEELCPLDGDAVIDHEEYRGGAAPKAEVKKRVKGMFGLSPCAVPGISLTNYRLNAQQKGWGAPCTGARTTVTLSNGARVTVRTEIAELSRLLMEECLKRGYVIRKADTGAYNCRKIGGTSTWSNHAWAIAIDINWQSNPYVKVLRTDMPGWMPALFNRYGFAWGGDYSGSKDAMHYEFMGTPAQAAAATALAIRELNGKPAPAPAPAPNPDAIVYREIAMGDVSELYTKGEQARQDQFNLNDTGFKCDVDGFFGPGSVAAAKAFQKPAGLKVDGVVGPATREALRKVPSWNYNAPNGGHSDRAWQQELKNRGWRIVVDGDWGPRSIDLLKQFQAEKGLEVDGLRGPATWTALNAHPVL